MNRIRAIFTATLLILVFPTLHAHAHGNGSGGVDKCSQSVANDFNMHMTSYIPDDYGGREFCYNIPDAGRVIVVFDMLEVHLRHHETDVRIIKDMGPDTDLKTNTIFHMPFQKITTGSLYFDHDYEDKGKYVGIISVRDHGETHVTRFPYSVGYGIEQKTNKNYGTIAALLLAFFAGIIWWRRRAKNKSQPQTNHA